MAPHVPLEAVLSSRIEGTRTGVEDLLRYESGFDDGQPQTRDDAHEVGNYIAVLDHGLARLEGDLPRGVAAQASDAEERTVRLVQLQLEMRQRLLAERVSSNVVRAADQLFGNPFVSPNLLAKALDVSYPTALSTIGTLVDRGDLTEVTGRKRNRYFFAWRIFDAIYGTDGSAES